MLRTTIATFVCGAFLITAAAGTSLAADECKIAKDEKTDVGKACKEGGLKRAKAVMKAMTKEAKKKDMKVDCDTCHKNEESWDLTGDAKDKFAQLLKTIGK